MTYKELEWKRMPKGTLCADVVFHGKVFEVNLVFEIEKLSDNTYGDYALYTNFFTPMIFNDEQDCKDAAYELLCDYIADITLFIKEAQK